MNKSEKEYWKLKKETERWKKEYERRKAEYEGLKAEHERLKIENDRGMEAIKKRLEETALLAQKNQEGLQELKEQVKITTSTMNSLGFNIGASTELAQKNQEGSQELKVGLQELKEQVKITTSTMNSLGFNIGGSTETTFYNSLEKSMKINEIVFYDIYKNMKSKNDKGVVQVEIDMLMVNKKYVAVIETKHTARLEDLDKLINSTIPKFRMYFPLYNDFLILPYLGAMNFVDKLIETAREKKIGILKFSGDVLEVL